MTDSRYNFYTDSGRVRDPIFEDFPTPELVTSTPRMEAESSTEGNRLHRPQAAANPAPGPTASPEAAMAGLTSSLTSLLQEFTSQVVKMNGRRERPSQTFAGLLHESPAAFVSHLEDFFSDNGIREDHAKLDVFKGQLRGPAKRWSEAYDSVPIAYRELKESFLRRYNSTSEKSEAISTLYGEHQKVGEPAEMFLHRIVGLFSRLNPHVTSDVIVQVLVDQLIPPLHSRLRGRTYVDVQDLAYQAAKARADHQEEADYWRQV